MKARVLEGQMALELFPAQQRRYTRESMREYCIDWLCRYHKCDESEIRPYVMRLYDEFKPWEAFDRAKVLRHVSGKNAVSGWRIDDARDVLGIYDHALDYHTCWDRAYAAHRGYAKEDVARVVEWDYRKQVPIWA